MIRSVFFIVLYFTIQTLIAQDNVRCTIPTEGNGYLLTEDSPSADHRLVWQSASDKYVIFFHSEKEGKADLSLNLVVPEGKSKIKVSVGRKNFTLSVTGKELHAAYIGTIKLKAGYNKVEICGIAKEGRQFAIVSELLIQSLSQGVVLNYVKDNQDNRFYWGRRGPSVHLNYELPKGVEIEYFYNEVTIPVGLDPEGSYFMVDGFGEGYFGMQVNGPEERRILFSVWSPYKTDHPGEIPASDKIILLSRGQGVHTGEFGNEGSGGQSYFHYNWKSGTTYRFLLKGTPDGKGSTIFTAWFYAPEENKWQLIASFSRPKTDHYLTRLHSFVENFNDRNGYLTRKALYTNQWCRDKNGQWFQLTKARFTGDDIAKRGYRLDYSGGTEGNGFFLQNGGFFNSNAVLNSIFELKAIPVSSPEIDITSLE